MSPLNMSASPETPRRKSMYVKGSIVEISPSIEKIQSSGQTPAVKAGGFMDMFIAAHPPNATISAYEADE